MSWLLHYANPDGTGEASVALESFGALDGGQVTGDGVRFWFNSHKSSSVTVRVPAVDPKLIPTIPFMGRVRLTDETGAQRFFGRRTDWSGVASPESSGIEYTFEDAWWDMSKITFKEEWFYMGYTAVTVTGAGPWTVTFGGGVTVNFAGKKPSVQFYDASKNQIGMAFPILSVSGVPASSFVVGAGGVGTPTGAAYIAFVNETTDVVLFQYRPNDPYQDATHVVNYYITTGAQIIEILNFAISRGVPLQVGEVDPDLFVPWYPIRCQNCAEAIKVCLRSHPDCYTEIDYSTTPPTFHVRRWTSLVAKTLPYAYEDADGMMHLTTDIKPRPDLIPTRIGIFYRYVINGETVANPQDIWPADAPDGMLALDYSIDLQGPRMSNSYGEVQSVAFDPTSAAWWRKKCASLNTDDVFDLTMVNADGGTYTGADLKVLDDDGNPIDYTAGHYAYELIGGGTALWMTGVSAVAANLTTHFSFKKKKADGTLENQIGKQPFTIRVNLVNTPSIQQTFTSFLTTGEAIPPNLARNIYESLQGMIYEVKQSVKQEPLGEFVKPGKHCVNIHGGNAEWETMETPVQSTSYTLHMRPDGVVWGRADLECGPVEFLEAGQLVQLFNLFANRDLNKIDPWERITGRSSSGSGRAAATTTARENSMPGVAGNLFSSNTNLTADGNGHFSTVQSNVKTSGVSIFKWDGSTVDADGIPTAVSEKPGFIFDLSDVSSALAGHTLTPASGYSADDVWKLKARKIVVCDADTGTQYKMLVACGAPFTES